MGRKLLGSPSYDTPKLSTTFQRFSSSSVLFPYFVAPRMQSLEEMGSLWIIELIWSAADSLSWHVLCGTWEVKGGFMDRFRAMVLGSLVSGSLINSGLAAGGGGKGGGEHHGGGGGHPGKGGLHPEKPDHPPGKNNRPPEQ